MPETMREGTGEERAGQQAQATVPVLPTAQEPVVLTEAAVRKVVSVAQHNDEIRDKHLRVSVRGGGCSGFEYDFSFDRLREGDKKIAQSAGEQTIDVLVDQFSISFLQGCVIDYWEDFSGSGFKVKNPNAVGTCGCGHSFSG